MSRSGEFYESQKAHRHFGTNDVDRLIPPDGPGLAPVPWEQMSRRRDRGDYDRDLVAEHLRKRPEQSDFEELDPRDLRATQPSVTRAGVHHYLQNDYRTGNQPTFADQQSVGNRHPIVYRRADLHGGEPQHLLLSGHHRAAASLLQGRQFSARIIEGGWGPERAKESGPVDLQRKRPRLRDIG